MSSKNFKKLALLGLLAGGALATQALSADEENTNSSSGVNVDSEVILAGGCKGGCSARKAPKNSGEIADNTDYTKRPSYQNQQPGNSQQPQGVPAAQGVPPPSYTTYGCGEHKQNNQDGRRYYSDVNEMPQQGGSCATPPQPSYRQNGSRTSYINPYGDSTPMWQEEQGNGGTQY